MSNIYNIQKMTGRRRKCKLPFMKVQYFAQFWLPLSATHMLIMGELLGVGLLWCQATCKFDISSLPHDGSTCLTKSGNAGKTLLCIIVIIMISCLTFVDPRVEIDPSVLCINLVTWLKTHA